MATLPTTDQIAERVPQIRKVLKDTFGTADSEELQKMGVPVELFIKKTVDGFSRTIPRAIVGLQGRYENMTDAMTARTADFGTALQDNMARRLLGAHHRPPGRGEQVRQEAVAASGGWIGHVQLIRLMEPPRSRSSSGAHPGPARRPGPGWSRARR